MYTFFRLALRYVETPVFPMRIPLLLERVHFVTSVPGLVHQSYSQARQLIRCTRRPKRKYNLRIERMQARRPRQTRTTSSKSGQMECVLASGVRSDSLTPGCLSAVWLSDVYVLVAFACEDVSRGRMCVKSN